ncbi:MAG: hypothetical protein K8R85_05330 [Bacteroidetes bacterium]|nr:hypothetical protein [Bacteroidota bacterium]
MKITNKQCEYCNNEFKAKRTDAKFCSGACRQGAYLERIDNYYNNRNNENHNEAIRREVLFAESEKRKENQIAQIKRNKQDQEAKMQEKIDGFKNVMNEAIENIKLMATKRIVDDANKLLKECLTQLLEFEQQDETPLYKVNWLCERITGFTNDRYYTTLPSDYKHFGFIENVLVPKMVKWYQGLKYSRERRVNVVLSDELKAKFTDVLSEID